MKPKNFPDRKNTRRKIALSHLNVPPESSGISKAKRQQLEREEHSLQSKIFPHGKRDVRTKKRRSLSA